MIFNALRVFGNHVNYLDLKVMKCIVLFSILSMEPLSREAHLPCMVQISAIFDHKVLFEGPDSKSFASIQYLGTQHWLGPIL